MKKSAIICGFGMALWLIPALAFLNVSLQARITFMVFALFIAIIFLSKVFILRHWSEAKLKKQDIQQKRPEREADQTCCSLCHVGNWCCVSQLDLEELDTVPLNSACSHEDGNKDYQTGGKKEECISLLPMLEAGAESVPRSYQI